MRTNLPRFLLLSALLGAAGTTAAAGPKNPPPAPEPTPAWRTDEGKRDAWRDLARWYVDNDMPDLALKMVAQLNSVGESNAELRLIQGQALLAQGVPDEARPVLEGVVKELPKDPRPYRELGVLYADRGETAMALSMLERAVALDSRDASSRNNLGFLLLAEERCAESVTQLEYAVELDPSSTRYRNNLAFALVCAGDGPRALQLFRSTGTEVEARYNMGVAYERVDKIPSAVLQYQHAVSLDPEHAEAVSALTRLAEPQPTVPGEPR